MSIPLQIFLARNNVQAGPYTLAQFNQMLADKQVIGTDLMWHYGLNAWQTVASLVSTEENAVYAPQMTEISQTVLDAAPVSATATATSAATDIAAPANATYPQVERRKKTRQLVVAELSTRVKAKIIDLGLWLPMAIIPGFFMSPASIEKLNSMGGDFETLAQNDMAILALIPQNAWIACGIYLLLMLSFQAFMLHKYGQSLGKRLFNIRIVGFETGQITSIKRSFFMRSLLFIVLGQIIFFLFLVDLSYLLFGDRRTLHDRVSKTIVVNANDEQLDVQKLSNVS